MASEKMRFSLTLGCVDTELEVEGVDVRHEAFHSAREDCAVLDDVPRLGVPAHRPAVVEPDVLVAGGVQAGADHALAHLAEHCLVDVLGEAIPRRPAHPAQRLAGSSGRQRCGNQRGGHRRAKQSPKGPQQRRLWLTVGPGGRCRARSSAGPLSTTLAPAPVPASVSAAPTRQQPSPLLREASAAIQQ
jgi:hypothetical protein